MNPNLQYINELQLNLERINHLLSTSPDGTLHIKKRPTGYSFWSYYPSNGDMKAHEDVINLKDTKTLAEYGSKFYWTRLKSALEKELKALEKLSKDYDPLAKYEIYDSMPQNLQCLIEPIYESTQSKIARWYHSPYKTNTYPQNELTMQITTRGEYVRSRAECLIANTLAEYDLMYHYEEQLILSNKKKVFPDFTIAHPKTGEFKYIEFFGMMDNSEYSRNAFGKIQEYSSDPVYKDMIFIFDSPLVPFSTMIFKKLIEQNLLR